MPQMNSDHITGFEYGLLSSSGGGLHNQHDAQTTLVTGGSQRTGTYALQEAPTGALAAFCLWTYVTQTAASVRTHRFAMMIPVLPASGSVNCFEIRAGSTVRTRLRVSSTGLIEGSLDGTNFVGSTVLTNPTTTWHIIEVKLDFRNATNILSWKIDNATQTPTTFAGGTTSPTNWNFGTQTTTGPAATMRFDDASTSTDALSYSRWYGNGEVIGLAPGSDGTHSFTANDFSTGDAGTQRAPSYTDFYLMVDELPWTGSARSTTDNIAQRVSRTAGYVEIAPTPASSTKPIANDVTARLQYSSPTTTANNAGAIVRNSAGTEVTIWGASGATADYSENTQFYKRAMVAQPTAGWTKAEIDAIRFRIGFSTDISPVPTWQALMLEVDYPIIDPTFPKPIHTSRTAVRLHAPGGYYNG